MVSTLVSLAERSLAGTVLKNTLVPQNNNPCFLENAAAFTVTIYDTDESSLVAYGAVHVYSSKQAYCILGEVCEKYKKHTLWLEEMALATKSTRNYKVTRSVPYEVDRNAATLFEAVFTDHESKSAHLHLVDSLIEGTLGIANMDVMKNFTVDILKTADEQVPSTIKSWRDSAGFVVSDKYKYEQIKVNRFELLALDDESTEITTMTIGKDNSMSAIDYDADITLYDRSNYLSALLQTDGVMGRIAMKDGQVCGYGLIRGDRILQCYGDDEEVMRKLLSSLGGDITEGVVSMFVRQEMNDTMNHLLQVATVRNRVTRLHTRTTSLGFKSNRVACPNMGLHMF